MKYKLRDWMLQTEYRGQSFEAKLKDSLSLSSNYNAIDYIKDNNIEIAYDYLSKNTNPKALPLLVERIHTEMNMTKKDFKDDENRIDWESLWANINIFELIELLKKDLSEKLSEYPNYYSDKALKLFNNKLNNPNYSGLSANSSDKALDILLKNIHRIDYGKLSGNTNTRAIELIKKKLKINPKDTNINWDLLSGNTNPRAIELIRNKLRINPKDPNINWEFLSGNSARESIKLLKANPSKINMKGLSSNSSDWALNILEAEAKLDIKAKLEARSNAYTIYRSKIDYCDLSGNTNPRAIEILKNVLYSINWIRFCANPSIFYIDNSASIDNRIVYDDEQCLVWIKDPSIFPVIIRKPKLNELRQPRLNTKTGKIVRESPMRKDIRNPNARNPHALFNDVKTNCFHNMALRQRIIDKIKEYKHNNTLRLYTLNHKSKSKDSKGVEYEHNFTREECERWYADHLINPRTKKSFDVKKPEHKNTYIELIYTTIQYGLRTPPILDTETTDVFLKKCKEIKRDVETRLKIMKETDAYFLAKSAKYSFGVSTTSSFKKHSSSMSENAEKRALALDFKRLKKQLIFERLKQFFNDLSKEILREDSTLIKNITSSIKLYDTSKFNSMLIPNNPNGYTLTELVTTFIYNIYTQLSNHELQPSVEELYLSHINKRLRHKDSLRLLGYIERVLSTFIDNYKPSLDIKLKNYIKNIIDDTIPQIYVSSDTQEFHSGIESQPYYNFYYNMIKDSDDSARIPDENGRVLDEELRLPLHKGLMLRGITVQVMPTFEGDTGLLNVIVDENAQNGFTYEECKDWVMMPIVNPRTFKPIVIDSPLYNRLLFMSFQYNTNLIPRMLTSDGHDNLLALRKYLREIKIKDPPQTREQLEKYIRDEEKKANSEEDYTFKECLRWVRRPNKDPRKSTPILTDGKEYNMIFKQALLFDSKIQPMNITLTGIDFKKSVLNIHGIVERVSSNSEDIESDACKEACKAFNNIYEGNEDYKKFKSRMVKVCRRHNKNTVICMDDLQASIVIEFPTDVPTNDMLKYKLKYYEDSALASIFIYYNESKKNQDIYTSDFRKFKISGIFEINDKSEFSRKATIDAGGPIRQFFTNLFEELFCDDAHPTRPFICPKDNIGDRYYINPNFAPDEKFLNVIRVYKKNYVDVISSIDYDTIYTIIGKLLCLVFVNKEIKLPKQLSTYIITGLIKQPAYITIYDLLYFYAIEFKNAPVYLNMITDTQINFIDDIGENFNDKYVISKTGHTVKKDTCIKFLLQLAKHIVTKNFIRKDDDPISVKSMKSRYTSLFSGFNNKLRIFLAKNKVSVKQLNSMITNKKMDDAILREFASKINIYMEGINTLTVSEKDEKVEEMRGYITNIITNNKEKRDSDEDHYIFIRKLLKFWTALPNYEKDTKYTIYYKYGHYITYRDNEEENEIHHYNVGNLPISHTCFNHLEIFGYPQTIPPQKREQYIYDKLKLAVESTPGMELQ
jgi:hypothetical protein